jgi:hypothetical protein
MLDNTSVSPYTNSTGFANSSLVPLLNPEQTQKLKGYVFWMKLVVVLAFISLIPYFLVGLLLFIFIIGLPILIMAIFGAYLNFQLWKAAKNLEAIVNDNSQQGFNLHAFEFILKIGSYFKLSVLFSIAIIVSYILLIGLLTIFSSAFEGYVTQINKNIISSLEETK